jgi:hypothetical protein
MKMTDWIKNFRKTLATKDEGKIEEELKKAEDAEPGEGGIHVHTEGRTKYTDAKLDEVFTAYDSKHAAHDADIKALKGGNGDDEAIEGALEEEAPPGTGDKARKAKDSVFLVDSHRETIAAAEIIAPGLHMPVFDKATSPRDTYTAICGLRRKAIQVGARDSKTAVMLQNLRPGKAIDDAAIAAMPCGSVKDLFFALTAMKREANNAVAAPVVSVVAKTGVRSLADLNKKNAERYKN